MQAQRAWHAQTAEELAHAWVVGIVERTPLTDLSGIALGWVARQAPALVADLLDDLNASDRGPAELAPSAAACARALVRLREPGTAAAQVPRDLAVLHGLLADAIGRNVGPAAEGELQERSARLIELFGELHAEFSQALVEDHLEYDGRDAVTGLLGEPAFQDELGRLVAAGPHEGAPFSVLEIDFDGLGRVNVAAGRSAGDRHLRLVADALKHQLGAAGRLFRRDGDELAALLPGSAGPVALTLAKQLRQAAEGLAAKGMTAPVSIGVAAWPADASDAAELLECVREATYLAKASGEGVAHAESRLQRS